MGNPVIALSITPRPPPESGEAGFILAPWLTALPTAACDLLSILPVADVNGLTRHFPYAGSLMPMMRRFAG